MARLLEAGHWSHRYAAGRQGQIGLASRDTPPFRQKDGDRVDLTASATPRLVESVTRPNPEALLHLGTSLDLPAAKLLSLRLPLAPSGLRLGLAPSLPVGAGGLHVAVRAPGGEPVEAASISAKFLEALHMAALSAPLHGITFLSLFFTFSRGKRARVTSLLCQKKLASRARRSDGTSRTT
jgi:hypothetical protein